MILAQPQRTPVMMVSLFKEPTLKCAVEMVAVWRELGVAHLQFVQVGNRRISEWLF